MRLSIFIVLVLIFGFGVFVSALLAAFAIARHRRHKQQDHASQTSDTLEPTNSTNPYAPSRVQHEPSIQQSKVKVLAIIMLGVLVGSILLIGFVFALGMPIPM